MSSYQAIACRMSGWHSLSGYLYYKPGGALGKFKSKKRQWYLLEESECQVLYYKTKEDAKIKEPLGNIDLRNAGITLNPGEQNQFTIISNGKEHIFTAENHESMMIWLLGLQAKRDAYAKRLYGQERSLDTIQSQDVTDEDDSTDSTDSFVHVDQPPIKPKRDLLQTRSLTIQSTAAMIGQQQRQQRLARLLGDSVDTGMDMYKDPEPNLDGFRSQRSWDLQDGQPETIKSLQRQDPVTETESESVTDEVFSAGDDLFHISPGGTRRVYLKKTCSDGSEGKCSTISAVSTNSMKERNTSLDSVLDRDSDYYSQCISSQVVELEQQVINTKCELAKLMNRETNYKTMVEQRDLLIIELDNKIKDLEKETLDKKSMDKKLKEEIRQFQNQNKFLNQEVRRLAALQNAEQVKFADQEKAIHQLETDIQRWKRDYLFVLQSTITVPSGDMMEANVVNLYGGDSHKKRIKELLDEARQSNPSLPTYERFAMSDIHIDNYGFKHTHEKESLLLHYISVQLNHHYINRIDCGEPHLKRWKEIMKKSTGTLLKTKELKTLCRRGIPPNLRKDVWKRLIYTQVKDVIEEKGPHYFGHLVNMSYDSQYSCRYRKQISLDLLRTMPFNVNFTSETCEGILHLKEILQAFCIHNPEVGYCQGMNFIAGMCLLFLEPEESFWALIAICEKYFAPNYFDPSLSGAQADQEVMKDLMKEKLPNLYTHFEDVDIEISTVTLNWFLAIFFDSVPFETLIRIWDCFLLEGPKVLFRISLAILKINEEGILQKRDTIGIMKHLKCCAKLSYDVEGLLRVAFEDLRPFPRRQDIAAKQVVYLNALKEKMRKRDLYRKAFAEKDQMFREMDQAHSAALTYECAVSSGEDTLWVCYGSQTAGKICVMKCTEGLMHPVHTQLDSRIMCSCSIEDEIILMGSLSWHLHAFSVKTRQELWCLRLHDSVFSMTCLFGDKRNRLFCGLADGTIAIIEQIQPKEPRDEPFYIPVGRAPVTSLLLLDNHLWAGCGNNVHVIHAETLDTVEKFTVSTNNFDHILSLSWSADGVWITLKGSSIIELWDEHQYTCKMMYDITINKCIQQRKDEEGYLNHSRITSVIPFDNNLWIGTGDGNLIMYEILDQQEMARKRTESQCISAIGSPNMCPPLETEKLMEKMQELYCQRLHQDRRDSFIRQFQDAQMMDGFSAVGSESTSTEQTPVSEKAVDDNRLGVEKKRLKKTIKKQQTIEEAYENKIKIIDVDSGSVEMVDPNKNGSSDSARQSSTSSFDNHSNFSSTCDGGSPRILHKSQSTPKIRNKAKLKRLGDVKAKEGKLQASSSISDDEGSRVHRKKPSYREAKLSRADNFRSGYSSAPGVSPVNNSHLMLRPFASEPNADDRIDGYVKSNKQMDTVADENQRNVDKSQSSSNGTLTNGYYDMSPSQKDSNDNNWRFIHRKEGVPPSETFAQGRSVLSNMDPREHSLSPIPHEGSTPNPARILAGPCFSFALVEPTESSDREGTQSDSKDELPKPPTECNEKEEAGIDTAEQEKSKTEKLMYSEGTKDQLILTKSKVPDLSPIHENKMRSPSTPNNPAVQLTDAIDNKQSPLIEKLEHLKAESPVSVGSPCSNASSASQEKVVVTVTDNGQCDIKLKEPTKKTPTLDRNKLRLDLRIPKPPHNTPCNFNKPEGNFLFVRSSPEGTPSPRATPKSSHGKKRKNGHKGRHSRTPSSASINSSQGELMRMCELNLQAKIKISDKPIRCLIMASHDPVIDKPVIVSCAGCYGDDEAVLKWRKEPDEKIWTNEPVFEVCPVTKTLRKPSYSYMMSRMSSLSSTPDVESCNSSIFGSAFRISP